MRIVASFSLLCMLCAAAWGQSGFSGSMSSGTDVEIFFQSKLEPPAPPALGLTDGVAPLPGRARGMRRYSANTKTHEYFGYDIHVDPIDPHAGVYRVTFSALSLTPFEMNLADSANWRSLPPPAFPAPQIINIGDIIAVTLFENPTTSQKVMDYIRITRHNCDAESGHSQVACLNGLIEEEQKTLSAKMANVASKRGGFAAAPIQDSQPLWEKYRDAACGGGSEAKRLQCKLELTRERTHDIGNVY